MAQQRARLSPDPTWLAFAERHPNQPFVQEDPLYALSKEVIETIKEQVPDFFRPAQEAFEYDLARSTGQGFFLQHPIPFDRRGFGEIGPVQGEATAGERHVPGLTLGDFISQVRSLPGPARRVRLDRLNRVLGSPNVTEEEAVRAVQEFLAHVQDAETRPRGTRQRQHGEPAEEFLLRRRREGYAGWLVLNPTYRAEADALRQQCQRWLTREGRFPCVGEYLGRAAPPGEYLKSCRDKFLHFYQRWGLDRLSTWELPLPMNVVRCEIAALAGQAPSMAGVALLIPWPLLRGEQVDFQASLARLRTDRGPAHLLDWLTSEQESEEGTAQTTYQVLFFLYRVYELVLFRRYQQACERRLARLDRALASVLGRSEELVRKLRQRLQKALHSPP